MLAAPVSAERVLVASNAIWMVDTDRSEATELAPLGLFVKDLAVDAAGQIYASDPAMFRVLVYDATGEIKASFGRFGTELDSFAMPNGLAFDPITNQILVADADNQRVMVFPTVP